jgi:hypothetical protein
MKTKQATDTGKKISENNTFTVTHRISQESVGDGENLK